MGEESPNPNVLRQNPSSCWSNIVKNPPTSIPRIKSQTTATSEVLVESCKSTKGISVAVVDANAVIEGGQTLTTFADKFVTVPEVLAEIRDPVSRHRLSFIPFSIDAMEPSLESLNKVVKFAKATGDLQALSDVDLKLMALTYTLEAQIHGTKHLRELPPPVHLINVKRLPEKDLPGWGSNVSNLEEWEALENESENKSDTKSRILPLKDLSLNTVSSDNHFDDGLVGSQEDTNSKNQDYDGHGRPGRYLPQKKEISTEGKKMVASGIDASRGQFDDNADDWMPAVSRSTHRRYLRRKARREYHEALSERDCQQDQGKSTEDHMVEDNNCPDLESGQSYEYSHAGNGISENNEMKEGKNCGEDLSSMLDEMRLEEHSLEAHQEDAAGLNSYNLVNNNNRLIAIEGDEVDVVNEVVDHVEVSSQTNETVDASYADDISNEQSLMLRSLSESSVACVTSDFAMQNVLLQMGLRLLAPGGKQIRQVQRWILKCHACYTVTAEIGRIFCPKCGNGGTLRKVAVTVGENGITLAARRPRVTLRGTKFSLPAPKGGRDAIAKNLILREDQLPQKLLYPKTKKKVNKEGDDFFPCDDIFTHHSEKKAPHQATVRQVLAVFSGKRNPNDNHYSRSKRG